MALLFSLLVILTLVSADVVDGKECIMCELEDWTFLSRACAAPENLLGLGVGLCVSVVFCVLPLVAGVDGVSPPNFCITGLVSLGLGDTPVSGACPSLPEHGTASLPCRSFALASCCLQSLLQLEIDVPG